MIRFIGFLLSVIFSVGLPVLGLTFGAAVTYWWGLTMYNWLLR